MTDSILFVTKRRTSGKDMVEDRFGRYYHLARELSHSQRQVVVAAADYQGQRNVHVESASLTFVSARLGLTRAWAYAKHLEELAAELAPSAVVAGGDIHFGWFGRRVARSLNVPFVFDVFDNYGAFQSAAIPGFNRLFKGLIQSADLVTVVSPALAGLVGHSRVALIPNGVDMDAFRPSPYPSGDGHSAVVGYVGGMGPTRGTETLIDAVERLRSAGRDTRLVMAGPLANGFDLPEKPWLDYLGVVPQEGVPALIGSVDVAVLPYPDTEWARYTSPYKLLEYMACEVPVVVTDVSAFRSLAPADEAVCVPGDPEDMARAIDFQLRNRVIVPRREEWSWRSRAAALAAALAAIT